MSLVETSAAVALDVTAVALLGWTLWLAVQSRDRPSAPPFIVILALLTVLGGLSALAELPGTSAVPALAMIIDIGQFGVGIVVPGVWVVYALSYTGRGTGLTRRRIAMFLGMAVPVVLSAIVVALRPPKTVGERLLVSFIGAEIMLVLGLFTYGTYLLVGHGWNHARISRGQVAIVIAAIAAPYLAGGIGSSDPVADGVTIGLLVSGGLLAVAVRQYPVMTGFPKAEYVARTRVVEALQEAVIVLDWEDHVLDANATTAELFGQSPQSMIGDPLRSITTGLEGTDLSAGATGTIPLQTTKGRRRFQFSVSAVDNAETDTDDGAGPVARTVMLRDVTDRQTREQRLAVLNRVLRHNVRNELDVVLAYADRIDDEDVRDGIRDSATDLVELSSKARAAEDVMTASAGSPEPVDLAAVARDVVEEYRTANRPCEISLSCPGEILVSSHRSVVRRVLSELVDNAITHADRSPRIEITARASPDGTAELVVADDGPGIPAREREILGDGTETQLEHGSGIGLWFVNWAVTQLGGDLSFRENEPTGSVVTVRLYDTDYSS
ncbi:putative PAS/PAC sensing his kinase [Natrinema pellirubrum DSM 15624]|uniref:histidine kinase n=1 Tax=Natrinema pellirubrum (strain DSM 15624 / CIP 106293 / JCM 10476 / NCIMB 786 / 157) TaxID=797303 RepID=L0JM55_NATP1|nr:ATP-binding protein [Natrinema pellirubrum]AGB31667.1 histidine kinase [Natrinema pellirubrum DSM 15624]ELY73036.1 putative PAS/PAC sensing his kinase [Natrinema pellirubrum DSM 15624]